MFLCSVVIRVYLKSCADTVSGPNSRHNKAVATSQLSEIFMLSFWTPGRYEAKLWLSLDRNFL